MSNERKRPYFDPAIFEANRAKRAEDATLVAQLVREIKQAFGFGKCKIVENQSTNYTKESNGKRAMGNS